MVTTVIFDLDGLLADTEKLHRSAYQTVFARFGVRLSDADYDEHWIRLGKGVAELIEERRLALAPDVVRAEKSRKYKELVRRFAAPMPGAMELLAFLKGKKDMALATSSYADAAYAVLGALGITDWFSCIATKENVERLKPNPDLFLYVAGKLKVTPERCLVFEDSEKGVLAAHAAGMKCIAVPNQHTANHDFATAAFVLASLEEVSLEMIERMSV